MPSTLRRATACAKVGKSLQFAQVASQRGAGMHADFLYMRESWVSTVLGVTNSVAAICLLEMPSATSSATRRSAGVSTLWCARDPDPRDIGARARRPGRRAETLERARAVPASRGRLRFAWLGGAARPREQRARALERAPALACSASACSTSLIATPSSPRAPRGEPRPRAAPASADARPSARPALLEPAEHRLRLGSCVPARSPLRPRRPRRARARLADTGGRAARATRRAVATRRAARGRARAPRAPTPHGSFPPPCRVPAIASASAAFARACPLGPRARRPAR